MDLAAERSYPTPIANVTLLPLLLMSLTKQKHSPNTVKTINTEYDYIIVGAGSAGSVVASRLSEMPCVSVLLLEAGKPPPLLTEVPGLSRFFWFTDIDWQYKTVPQRQTGTLLNNRQVIWPGGKTLGGSSVLNGMLYVRGNRQNYDQWEEEGAEGWSYNDVLPYFKKMEDNRDWEFVANGYHGVRGPQTVHRPRYEPEMKHPVFQAAKSMGYRVVDPNGPTQTGFYDLQSTMRSGQRCSTAKAYLVPAENRTNLDILPNAFVKKVLIKKRQAVGVQFDFEGNTYDVKARKEVIVSAGTINTAKLLMLSGIGPREELRKIKIPVVADLPVGKNLQDHCASNVNFELKQSIQPYLAKVTSPASILQYVQNRTGPLGSSEFCNTIAFLQDRVIVPEKDFPDHALVFAEALSELGIQIGLRPEVQAQVYLPYEGKPFYTCLAHLLHPRSRGTVTLQSSDPYDPPVIDPNYFENPKDIDDLVEGLKVCNRIGTSPAMRKLGSVPFRTLIPGCEKYVGDEDLYLRCHVKSIIFTVSHQVGTARMGNPKDPRTVVDPELRVKTLKGLRVVDASVMPIIPSGNTNVPTIMVAEKAADIIKSTITCLNDDEDDDRWPELEKIAWTTGPLSPTDPLLYASSLPGQPRGVIREASGGDKEQREMPTNRERVKKYLSKDLSPEIHAVNNDKRTNASWNSEAISLFLNDQESVVKSELPFVKNLRNKDSSPSQTPEVKNEFPLDGNHWKKAFPSKYTSLNVAEPNVVPLNSEVVSPFTENQKSEMKGELLFVKNHQNNDISPNIYSIDKGQYLVAPWDNKVISQFASTPEVKSGFPFDSNLWKKDFSQPLSKEEPKIVPLNREVISPFLNVDAFKMNNSPHQSYYNPFNTNREKIVSVKKNILDGQPQPENKILAILPQLQSEVSATFQKSQSNRPFLTDLISKELQKPLALRETKSTVTDQDNKYKRTPLKMKSVRLRVKKEPEFRSLSQENGKTLLETVKKLAEKSTENLTRNLAIKSPVLERSRATETLRYTEHLSDCDKDFCDSLLKFTKCQGSESCQKKTQVVKLLLQLLCLP